MATRGISLFTCLLGARSFSLRLWENAQGGNGPAVMLLRVPYGSVLLQKFEYISKNPHKKTRLCLESIRLFALITAASRSARC